VFALYKNITDGLSNIVSPADHPYIDKYDIESSNVYSGQIIKIDENQMFTNKKCLKIDDVTNCLIVFGVYGES